MIPLTRTREVKDIPASLRGPKRLSRELTLLKFWHGHVSNGRPSGLSWKKRDQWKAGKDLLKRESNGKCAYCESPTDTVAHGDVEHFRPKSRYWWLAYCLDNHLYACQICNQSFKGDKFPVAPGGAKFAGPRITKATLGADLNTFVDTFAPDPVDVTAGYSLNAYLTACAAELSGLPDPYAGPPGVHFKWRVDRSEQMVWIEARTPASQFAFVSVENVFGLNRDELLKARWTLAFKHLDNYRQELAEIKRNRRGRKARKLAWWKIQSMMADDQPYAGMVRYFVKDAWRLKP